MHLIITAITLAFHRDGRIYSLGPIPTRGASQQPLTPSAISRHQLSTPTSRGQECPPTRLAAGYTKPEKILVNMAKLHDQS